MASKAKLGAALFAGLGSLGSYVERQNKLKVEQDEKKRDFNLLLGKLDYEKQKDAAETEYKRQQDILKKRQDAVDAMQKTSNAAQEVESVNPFTHLPEKRKGMSDETLDATNNANTAIYGDDYKPVTRGQKKSTGGGSNPPTPGLTTAMNKFDTEFNKNYNFLYSVRRNLESLHADRTEKKNKLSLGVMSPSSGEGVMGTTMRRLGAGTPENAAFASSVGKTVDIYRHDITGAAAGFPEMQRLEGRVPSTNDPEDTFKEKSKDSLIQGVGILKERIRQAKKKGIDTSVYEDQVAELEAAIPGDVPTVTEADAASIIETAKKQGRPLTKEERKLVDNARKARNAGVTR